MLLLLLPDVLALVMIDAVFPKADTQVIEEEEEVDKQETTNAVVIAVSFRFMEGLRRCRRCCCFEHSSVEVVVVVVVMV